jgi:hypothetical protein
MHYSNRERANHWRTLAADARAASVEMTEPEARYTLLSIAEGYERLAKRAERAPDLSSVTIVPIKYER